MKVNALLRATAFSVALATLLVYGGSLRVVFAAPEKPNPKDMTLGTWELNVAKSTFCPGPAPKRGSRIIVDRGWGLIFTTSKGISPDGKETYGEYVARYDGQDYPANIDKPSTESIVWKLVDPYHVVFYHKLGDKPVRNYTRVVSPDGNTMVQSAKRPGETCEEKQVFERQ